MGHNVELRPRGGKEPLPYPVTGSKRPFSRTPYVKFLLTSAFAAVFTEEDSLLFADGETETHSSQAACRLHPSVRPLDMLHARSS